MFGKASIFAFCLGCLFISACVVGQGRYFEVENKLIETQALLAEDKQSLADLQISNYELNAKIRNLENQLEKAKKDIDDVGGKDSVENIKASQEILEKIFIEIEDNLREIDSPGVRVEKMDGKLKITFGNNLLFVPDSLIQKCHADLSQISGCNVYTTRAVNHTIFELIPMSGINPQGLEQISF